MIFLYIFFLCYLEWGVKLQPGSRQNNFPYILLYIQVLYAQVCPAIREGFPCIIERLQLEFTTGIDLLVSISGPMLEALPIVQVYIIPNIHRGRL